MNSQRRAVRATPAHQTLKAVTGSNYHPRDQSTYSKGQFIRLPHSPSLSPQTLGHEIKIVWHMPVSFLSKESDILHFLTLGLNDVKKLKAPEMKTFYLTFLLFGFLLLFPITKYRNGQGSDGFSVLHTPSL